LKAQAFSAARSSLCEDITIVRRLVERGEAVGFYETEGLAEVSMYGDWREAWENWPRSLPMRDQYFGWRQAIGLLEVFFVQGLPVDRRSEHIFRRKCASVSPTSGSFVRHRESL
jgi:dolichol-phosphate mannosyltransferase